MARSTSAADLPLLVWRAAGNSASLSLPCSHANETNPMQTPRPTRLNAFTGGALDRPASRCCDDMAWIAAALVAPSSRPLPLWRTRAHFCGVCGGACAPARGSHLMVCSACGTEHSPRTDPAAIMLVISGERALFGHAARFPRSDMYSALAGFVEPGESLEKAVAREVAEETGVIMGAVFYYSSQPWPFPASLMVGFYAEAASVAVRIDLKEPTDARWFPRAELVAPHRYGFSLPPPESIARRLIEDWVAAG